MASNSDDLCADCGLSEGLHRSYHEHEFVAQRRTLVSFVPLYKRSDNEWWKLSSGDHMNLFDEALDRIDDLVAERDRLRAVLERIHGLPTGGIPGHSVAVGCRHNIVAWKALNAPNEVECSKCDGRGFMMDYGPWKTVGEFNSPNHQITDERAEPGDPTGIGYGRRISCGSCTNGWIVPQVDTDG